MERQKKSRQQLKKKQRQKTRTHTRPQYRTARGSTKAPVPIYHNNGEAKKANGKSEKRTHVI